jgi:hypothetical protein
MKINEFGDVVTGPYSYVNVGANPNSANADDSLADGCEKAGRWKEAARASERAVALATRFAHPNRSDFVRHARKLTDRLEQEAEPRK